MTMPDLSDAFRMIRELQSEVRRHRTGIDLESASIGNGQITGTGFLRRAA